MSIELRRLVGSAFGPMAITGREIGNFIRKICLRHVCWRIFRDFICPKGLKFLILQYTPVNDGECKLGCFSIIDSFLGKTTYELKHE